MSDITEIYRDALDHISRVARNSITQSRRERWIEARANWALEGKEFSQLDMPNYPKMKIDKMETEITTLRQQVAELEAAEKRYFDVFRRISEAHGISSPLVLIGKAINDDENYAEILARIVEEKQSKVLAGDTKKDTSA